MRSRRDLSLQRLIFDKGLSLSIKTTVLRHRKENFKKCSLTPLEHRSEIDFYTAPGIEYNATGYIILSVSAPLLSAEDRGPLLLLDATWRLLPQLEACVTGDPVYRSLPKEIMTAYPRVSSDDSDPSNGLASVEALFMARLIMGDRDESLLNGYHWKESFLSGLPGQYQV